MPSNGITATIMNNPSHSLHRLFQSPSIDKIELENVIEEESLTEKIEDVLSNTTDIMYTSIIADLVDALHEDLVPADVLNIGSGFLWNILDGLLNYILSILKILHLSKSKRRQKEKAFWAVHDFMVAHITNVASVITLLSQYGVLHGATLIFGALGPFAFAIGAITHSVHSLIQFCRLFKKWHDPVYLFEDKVIKYENLSNKIAHLNRKLVQAANKEDEEKIKLIEEIKTLRNIREGVKAEAIAIAQVELTEENFEANILKARMVNALNKYENITIPTATELLKKPADENHPAYRVKVNFIEKLKKERVKKLISSFIDNVGGITGAIAMTLMAIAPFLGPVAPVVMLSGILIASITAAIKVGKIIVTIFKNALAKRYAENKEKETLFQNQNYLQTNEFQDLNLTDKQKRKFKLFFEKYYPSEKDNQQIEIQCYKDLLSIDRSDRKKLLNKVIQEEINHRILVKTLREGSVDGSDEEIHRLIGQLSDQQKSKLIKERNHREFNSRVKNYFFGESHSATPIQKIEFAAGGCVV